LIFALLIGAIIGLGLLVAYIAFLVSYGGSDTTAIFILILGFGGILVGAFFIIKRMFESKEKKKARRDLKQQRRPKREKQKDELKWF